MRWWASVIVVVVVARFFAVGGRLGSGLQELGAEGSVYLGVGGHN